MSVNNSTIEGRVIHVGQIEQVSDKFKKRQIVVETADKYPQQIPVQFSQDNVFKIDNVNTGDMVRIETNIRGREWNGKWFMNLDGWRIELTAQGQPAPTTAEQVMTQDYHAKKAQQAPPVVNNSVQDDLPF